MTLEELNRKKEERDQVEFASSHPAPASLCMDTEVKLFDESKR